MPLPTDSYVVTINGHRYKAYLDSYIYSDLAYFSQPSRDSNPKYKDWLPETVIGFDTFQNGFGDLYYDPTSLGSYYTAAGLDGSVQQQVTLALAAATTFQANSVSVGESIRYWPEFKNKLYAAGSHLWVWDPTASPNGWGVAAASGQPTHLIGQPAIYSVLASASTAAIPGGQYIYTPSNNTEYLWDGTAWRNVATPAAHFLTIRNELWKIFYDSNGIWQTAKSSDGVTYGGALIIGDGTATVNAAVNYDNRMYLLTTHGVTTVDSSGTWYDLIPEIGQYGDPGLGYGATVFHDLAYLPSNYGLLQFTGTNVLNPQAEASARSIGPDQQSWSKSNVRGKFNGLAAHVNYMYATMTSQAGNGYVLKYRDYPDLPPGHGWHPIASMGAITMGGAKVSALSWYGTSYPILWFSAGNDIYEMRLPSELDNPLVDTNVLYTPSGTLDLPIIDDQMPTLQKNWIRYILDASIPSGAALSMQASLDGGSFSTIGTLYATTGSVEIDFDVTGTAAYRLQPRITMTATTVAGTGGYAQVTPVVRSVAVHHHIRPDFRRQWQMDLAVQTGAVPGDARTPGNILSDLETARKAVGPIVFTDLLNNTQMASMEQLQPRIVGRDPGQGVQLLAHVELQDYPVNVALSFVDEAIVDVSLVS